MKFKSLGISLIVICYSISAAENGAINEPPQLLAKKSTNSQTQAPLTQKMSGWLKDFKNNLVAYTKKSLPKTKKEWVITIISEGLAEGVLMFTGLKNLVKIKRDKAEDIIEQSKGWGGEIYGDLTEIEKEEVEEKVTQIVDNVVKKTGMEEKVAIHYTPDVRGAFAYAQTHIFILAGYSYPKYKPLGAASE